MGNEHHRVCEPRRTTRARRSRPQPRAERANRRLRARRSTALLLASPAPATRARREPSAPSWLETLTLAAFALYPTAVLAIATQAG
ncbi:MAG: hypothetical protein KDE27_01585 [Planctomycetes bacterium]|nr:hypothetical protein [Planctomycetota bacterium]